MNRLQMLKDAGVEIHHDYEYRGDPPRERFELEDTVRSIAFPLTAEEWVYLTVRDPSFQGADEQRSAYVGGCCGDMGVLQDTMNYVFRDGWCDNGTFLRIGEMARGHDGFEKFAPMTDEEFRESLRQWKESEAKIASGEVEGYIDPWDKLGIIYNGVEPYLKPRDKPKTAEQEKARNPGEREFDLLSRTLAQLDWTDLFSAPDDDDRAEQHFANRTLFVARLLEPTRAVLKQVERQMADPYAGFAVVEKGTDEVMRNMGGECIYATRESAERLVELWGRNDPDTAAAVEIVPITISLGQGLVVHRA